MYLRLDITAGARTESIKQTSDDCFAISVKEKPERNMANRRVLELIRLRYGAKGVIVKLVSGHHSPRKIVSVEITPK
ncbi:MAG: DUF167 domain-containing protein [Candidatus Taylorbacteria bacterium]|nr:DUF167 domain-containing protein [Candidatus Taylorbacteria bacterium]